MNFLPVHPIDADGAALRRRRVAIVAGALTGKSTCSRMWPSVFADPDDARAAVGHQLAPLRVKERWDEHNRVWHGALRRHFAARPQPCVFAHSIEDARALDVDPGRILWWRLDVRTLLSRARDIIASEPERAYWGLRNWAHNEETCRDLPVWDGSIDYILSLTGGV